MLNRVARALLVLTAVAPIGIVAGIARLTSKNPTPEMNVAGGLLLAVAAVLVVAVVALFRWVRKSCTTGTFQITKADRGDKNVLAFLVTYLLPLIAPTEGVFSTVSKTGSTPALVVFVLLMAVVLYQSQMLNVNPLLGILGYHFFDVEADGLVSRLLITTRESVGKDTVVAYRLSDSVWLEVKS